MYRDSEKIKKLDGYTKAEIITALMRIIHGTDIDRLICHLEGNRIKNNISEQEKADAAATVAMQAFLGWRSEMVQKYGDGEQVRLVNVPQDEIVRGAALEKAWTDARKKVAKLEAEFKLLSKV